jgi:hypothetical protein
MKKEIVEIAKKELEVIQSKTISRKEAIKKTGYIALSAATMMLLLKNPAQAQGSPAPPPADSPSGGGYRGPWK